MANSPAEEIINAAVDSTVSQGANIALGLQKSFSWEAVAAAAVAAPIAQDVGAKVGTDLNSDLTATEDKIVSNLASASVDQATYALATGRKINYAQIVADGFGNAIGDAIVQADAGSQYGLTNAQQQQEYSDISAGTSAALAQENTQISADNSAQIDAAAGGSALAQNAPLTGNEQLPDPVIQLQNINVDAIPLPPIDIVGAEGTQGYWGVAKSLLPAGASNAEIEQQALQLMTANPGVTTLHEGDVLNLGDGSISSEAEETYSTMDQTYQAQQLAELQPVIPSAGLLAEGLQASASDANGGTFNNATGLALPPIEELGPGYGQSQVNTAWAEAENPNNTWYQRAIFGVLAVAAEPDAMVESAARSIANTASVAGQEAAAAHLEYQAGDINQGNIYALSALESGATSFDEAALAVVAPELVEAAPALTSSSLAGSGLAITAGKTAVGFTLGYSIANATGSGTAGDWAAGVTGAVALNFGGGFAESLTEALPALGKFGSTAIVSGAAGSLTEFNAQATDYFAGNISTINFAKVGYMGLTTSAASLTMGESALATMADYADLGPYGKAITDSVGGVLTGLGSFVAGKIWEGPTSGISAVPANNPAGLGAPNAAPNSILW